MDINEIKCPLCGSIHLKLDKEQNICCQACNTTFSKESFEGTRNLTTSEIYERVIDSVMEIDVISEADEFSGTGVIIDNAGHILTSAHILSPEVKSIGNITNYCSAIIAQKKEREDGFKLEVCMVDENADMAILYAKEAAEFPPIQFSSLSLVSGSHVCAIGNSKGEGLSVVDGIISDHARLLNHRNCILISAPVTTGYSGGPVINDFGRMVGLVLGGHKGTTSMNYALNLQDIQEFIHRFYLTLEKN